MNYVKVLAPLGWQGVSSRLSPLWVSTVQSFDVLNESPMNLVLILLIVLLWVGWCALHSLLIGSGVSRAIRRRMPGIDRYYRLLYNGLALLTLVPVAIVTGLAEGPVVFSWEGWGHLFRAFLLVCAFLLFWGGAHKYDMRYFLGFRQLETGQTSLLLTDAPKFTERGVFGLVRHPWYLGSLLLIWSALPEYQLPKFLVAIILSCYLVIGTLLEERKILARHSESYIAYQQRVSMLLPWKWLKKRLRQYPLFRIPE